MERRRRRLVEEKKKRRADLLTDVEGRDWVREKESQKSKREKNKKYIFIYKLTCVT